MGRRKTNKEYTIKLIHPEFGDYYLGYVRNSYTFNYYRGSGNHISYIFTKDLNKVTTWKNTKTIDAIISGITDGLSKKSCEVLLSFGTEINVDLMHRVTYSRKKYYFNIFFATSQSLLNKAQNNINSLDVSLIKDCESILETIKNGDHLNKEINKKIKKLDSEISSYQNDYYFLQKSKIDDVLLDIVDASYGFRFLKLKNLNDLNNDSEESGEL